VGDGLHTFTWQLIGVGVDGVPWTIPISTSPFRVGRKEECQLCLSYENISRHHAELRLNESHLLISDLGSTNGTFVNCQRLENGESRRLQSGDMVHFAGIEFKVHRAAPIQDNTVCRDPYVDTFQKMLESRAVVPHYQPLVRFCNGTVFGYEVLGRVSFPGLPETPGRIFSIARRLGGEAELSALFRDVGIANVVQTGYRGTIFFNTLPIELQSPALPQVLARLRQDAPNVHLALEVHENTIADVPTIQALKKLLNDHEISLVYDDFGAGQARLVEVVKVPPDYLKFDVALIRDIHRSPGLQNMVGRLVRICRDAGIVTLAEGIEKPEEAEVCRELGFELAQGFYFGRPSPELPGST
jgi:EAL domain-containing protein (putative c-di-GMP-specific phosphodiesterase class I)